MGLLYHCGAVRCHKSGSAACKGSNCCHFQSQSATSSVSSSSAIGAASLLLHKHRVSSCAKDCTELQSC